jgi:hypothetical protein
MPGTSEIEVADRPGGRRLSREEAAAFVAHLYRCLPPADFHHRVGDVRAELRPPGASEERPCLRVRRTGHVAFITPALCLR